MKQGIAVCGLAVLLGLCLCAGQAAATDTSPYLVGSWVETQGMTVDARTEHYIINPTTKDLTVFALYYGWGGSHDYRMCVGFDLASNSVCKVYVDVMEADQDAGTVKFFAFPQGSTKFDPNAVIGGFQRIRQEVLAETPERRWTESNLKAVTLNSTTVAEFGTIGKCKEYVWCQGEPR